jgi:hypothetical protein
MQQFKPEENKIFVGGTDKLPEWSKDGQEQEKAIEKVKLMLKNYLELDNVSFLFGSGTSIHLGGVAIRNFPVEIEEYLKKNDKEEDLSGIYAEFLNAIKELQGEFYTRIEGKIDKETGRYQDENGGAFIVNEEIIRDEESNEIAVEFERILNYLIAQDYLLDENTKVERSDEIKDLIRIIKEGLFKVCDVDKREVPEWLLNLKRASEYQYEKGQADLLEKESKYLFHEKFIKSLLQRPLNLRRANIFTSNYDLAFEYAFDRLGVHYIDGFTGFHKRYFKPETFEFDLFYPGSTTSGKVQRIEKVVRYFKLHGSISWVKSEKRDSTNLYGIEEMPLKMIAGLKKKGEIIIYPTAVKKSFTLDLPYSELFRQFAASIRQSQSVLVTIGYSFADDHFNDIIFQALSNPTFTLIIVDYKGTANSYIKRIKDLDDKRIIILEGKFFGDFLTFASNLMPDFGALDTNSLVANTLNQYFKPEGSENND